MDEKIKVIREQIEDVFKRHGVIEEETKQFILSDMVYDESDDDDLDLEGD